MRCSNIRFAAAYRRLVLPALVAAAAVCGLRADIFISNGNTSGADVLSFSQYTGVQKLDISAGLTHSTGLAIGPDDNLYVADQGSHSVLRYNPVSGALIGTFVATGSGLVTPWGITFGPDGNLYVADSSAGVLQFNGATGVLMNRIATAGGLTLQPFDITFGPDKNLYVSDQYSGLVLQFNGSTLAFVEYFTSCVGDCNFGLYPWGLKFGPDGNLFVIYQTLTPDLDAETQMIEEFSGADGTLIKIFTNTCAANYTLAFGPDGNIYTTSSWSIITRWSPSTGQSLATLNAPGNSPTALGFIVFGGINLSPVPYQNFPGLGLTKDQTLHIVAGPVLITPGVPVQAVLGFVDTRGSAIGPTTTVTLSSGQTASLDLDGSTIVSTGRTEVRPVVTAPAGVQPIVTIPASAEIFDTANGFGEVLAKGAATLPQAPVFAFQGVAYGQIMRLNAVAPADSPCTALLSFTDSNGNSVGPTKNVSLTPGQTTSLDFNANSTTGHTNHRIEIQPLIVVQNVAGSPISACQGSVEVYDQRTFRTWTYQDSGAALR